VGRARACVLSLATLFVSIGTLRGLKFGPSKHDADEGPADDYDLPPLEEVGSAVDEASGRLHGVAPLLLSPKAQWSTDTVALPSRPPPQADRPQLDPSAVRRHQSPTPQQVAPITEDRAPGVVDHNPTPRAATPPPPVQLELPPDVASTATTLRRELLSDIWATNLYAFLHAFEHLSAVCPSAAHQAAQAGEVALLGAENETVYDEQLFQGDDVVIIDPSNPHWDSDGTILKPGWQNGGHVAVQLANGLQVDVRPFGVAPLSCLSYDCDDDENADPDSVKDEADEELLWLCSEGADEVGPPHLLQERAGHYYRPVQPLPRPQRHCHRHIQRAGRRPAR